MSGRTIRRIWPAVAAATGVMLLSSCASITVNSLPQPGGGYRDGYEIVMEFANVLNLPDRAKVVMDGTTVGVVTRVGLVSGHVDVISRVDAEVVVPSDVHATLQQATVLGDTYVALERPGDAAAPSVGSRGRIPLARTTSPPQLEDTIANMANFVASGSIQRVQNTMIGINRVTPPNQDEVRQVASRVAANLSDLSTNIDLVDQWLDGVSGAGNVMSNYVPAFEHWFSPAGMLGFDRGTESASYLGLLLPSIGSIYSGGFWLIPLLNSLAEAMGSVQQGKWAVEAEVPGWRRLFGNFFLPVDKFPAIDITSIVGPDGRELSGDVQEVLRILGATP